MKKQFKVNTAVGVVANVVRLRSHIVRNLKRDYRPISRHGRTLARRHAARHERRSQLNRPVCRRVRHSARMR